VLTFPGPLIAHLRYEGEFHLGEFHGTGSLYFKNGRIQRGKFESGRFVGGTIDGGGESLE
jgi:hypothetical protein